MADYGIQVVNGTGDGWQIDSTSQGAGLYVVYTFTLERKSIGSSAYCTSTHILPLTNLIVVYKGSIPISYNRATGRIFAPDGYQGQSVTVYCFKVNLFTYPYSDYGAVVWDDVGQITYSTAHSPLIIQDILTVPAMRPKKDEGSIQYTIPENCGLILEPRFYITPYGAYEWGTFAVMFSVNGQLATLSNSFCGWMYQDNHPRFRKGWNNNQDLQLIAVDMSKF
ncbi:hypothetical protein [Pragia fontium]|uniref:hypothetical protein n=1 Tax=Pragia fontium TaxID=82985 RepID=UPI00064A4EE1|nr:hypothetical protein [Pragia fontium]AKJ41485.1 hypothetical protein QQ39_04805 [Pragia fontium]